MKFISDKWLSEIIQRKAYAVKYEMNDLTDEKQYDILSSYLKIENVFLYVKIPANFLEMTHFFQKADFRIADVNVVYEKIIQHIATFKSNLIRFSTTKDQKTVTDLARNSFKHSRFHMDQEFGQDQADKIKSEWVNNFFLGKRGKWMIVAEKNEKAVGFLLLLEGENNSLVIDLIAVDSKFRGQGIAKQMITYAERKLNSFEKILAGTQIINFSSMHLYENMGFRASKSYYVLHYHNINNYFKKIFKANNDN